MWTHGKPFFSLIGDEQDEKCGGKECIYPFKK